MTDLQLDNAAPEPAPPDFDIKMLDPNHIRLRKEGYELTLTVDDRSYLQVEVRRAFPLSRRNQYIAFFDSEDKEIGMLHDVRLLPMDMRVLIEQELDKRYFTARIRKIHSCKEDIGLFKLDVDTDKGRREFHLRNLRDNVLRMGGSRLILTDVHGNRFEIRDVERLDARSLANIAKIV